MSNEKHTNCEEFSGLERGLEKRHGSLEATERDQVTIFDCSKRQEVLKEAKKKEMDIKAEKTVSGQQEQEGEIFPGLNKKHGFFKAIERNQVSRDDYHKQQEVRRERKKKELDAEVKESRSGRRKNREDRRPDRAIYQPPRTRSSHAGTTRQEPHSHHPPVPQILYCIEIEVKPGQVWTREVDRYGAECSLARDAARQYRLEREVEEALREIIQEYEAKLKLF